MKISIITINYNNAVGLEKTLQSVFSQTCADYEYIVIDGGSADDSKNIIVDNRDKFSYWCSEKDSGIYNAMNKGIRKAAGEYLLFLNSGDCFHDTTVLADMYPSLSGEDIVYGDLLFRYADGRDDLVVYPNVLCMDYFLQRSLGHPASFIKRSLFENCLYTETLKLVSDWEFFLKKIVLSECSYKHVRRTVSVFNMEGISSLTPELCEEEKNDILQKMFSIMVLDSLRESARMKQQPLYGIFCEFEKRQRLQKRIKPLLVFLLWLNNLFSKRR